MLNSRRNKEQILKTASSDFVKDNIESGAFDAFGKLDKNTIADYCERFPKYKELFLKVNQDLIYQSLMLTFAQLQRTKMLHYFQLIMESDDVEEIIFAEAALYRMLKEAFEQKQIDTLHQPNTNAEVYEELMNEIMDGKSERYADMDYTELWEKLNKSIIRYSVECIDRNIFDLLDIVSLEELLDDDRFELKVVSKDEAEENQDNGIAEK